MGATSTPMGVGKSFHRKWNSKMTKLGPTADPPYPQCLEEPKTVQPWLQRYPHLDVLRQRTFGSPSDPQTSAPVPGDRRPCPEQGQRRHIAIIHLRCTTRWYGGLVVAQRQSVCPSGHLIRWSKDIQIWTSIVTVLLSCFFFISLRRIFLSLTKVRGGCLSIYG